MESVVGTKKGMGICMLLAVDVGNTNITMGVFDGSELLSRFHITTMHARTSDEYGILLQNLLREKGFELSTITEVIVASVVPQIMHSFQNGIVKYIGCQPMNVGMGTKTGIRIDTYNPKQIGADRIVDAVGAYDLYGGPVLVVDFGTATTYDFVSEEGAFVAGVVCPGIRIAANAMWKDTAKLPEIEIEKVDTILAKETVASMQAGVFYGTIGQTEYIVQKFKEELGLDSLKVVATGGLGRIIAGETDTIAIYDSDLTLKGLQLIHQKSV